MPDCPCPWPWPFAGDTLDTEVMHLHRESLSRMRGPHELRRVPGASHLFEEPGALETVSKEAVDWYEEHLLRACLRKAG